jgi:hypothetical protein
MNDILNMKRPTLIPDKGLLCDLLWADPLYGREEYHASKRGVSVTFGCAAVETFLGMHNLELLCRGHQVVEDGYDFMFERRVVTVFSAPNYCGEFDNAGAMLEVNEDLVCSFKVLRPELHKTKFPGKFSSTATDDSSFENCTSLYEQAMLEWPECRTPVRCDSGDTDTFTGSPTDARSIDIALVDHSDDMMF